MSQAAALKRSAGHAGRRADRVASLVSLYSGDAAKMRQGQKHFRERQQGVTLLELMVVAAAVVVLGALAIPAYTGYVERARTSRAIGDIGTITLQLYRWQLSTRTFPSTLAEAGIALTDPWGRAYEYMPVEGTPQNQLRKDHNLHPINTDFDLYSVGPDGATRKPLTAQASRDDIIRANNGRYIGVAEKY
jgi:general secretion pathway protein G